MSDQREFDVIVWGASGFTGRLVAEYLFQTYGSNREVKWAMAGRNFEKLERVRSEVADAHVPLMVADSKDRERLAEMTRRTKAVATTVGPYAKYGSELVDVCVETKTHYADLAGEVQWMRKMIDQHHEAAQKNGAKIVHTCGFDSIPSDMGVYFTQKACLERFGTYAQAIHMRVKAAKGGMSGGTYASLNNMKEEAQRDKSVGRIMANPYGLNPRGEMEGPDEGDLQTYKLDPVTGAWMCPFIMAGINTKLVRRSNALLNYPYGKDFRYDETMLTGKGISGRLKAMGTTAAMGAMMVAKPGSLLKKGIDTLLPEPGEGPNEQQRLNGFYNLLFVAVLPDGQTLRTKVTGDRDPGYGSTSKMLAESALCLAQDDLPDVSGVLTPSVAMGDKLLERLRERAGLTFDVL